MSLSASTSSEAQHPGKPRFVEDSEGYLYDCVFRETVGRRLDGARLESAEALRAVALAGKTVIQAFEGNLNKVGLTHAQFRTLMAARYAGKPGIHMHEIAAWMGVTPRNVTAIVDALEAMGLVARVPDPRDRRAFLVRLTPAGDERAQTAVRINESDQRRVLSSLTTEEKKQLRHLCMKLVRAAGTPLSVKEVK